MPLLVHPKRSAASALRLGWVAALFFLVTGWGALQPALPATNASVVIEVSPHATADQIAGLLQEKGLIRSSLAFQLLAKFSGQEGKLKAGRYLFSPGQTPWEILSMLAQGKTTTDAVRVTVPEGFTIKQIARLLAAKGITDEQEFLSVARSGRLDSRFFADAPRPGTEFRWEGFFFPDTYLFQPDTPALQVAQRMLARTDEVWEEETRTHARLPLGLTPREVVTLASLVEREAKVAAERPLIARVFYNRLQAKMNLQSCATIQYLLPEPKPRLLDADTRLPSPYNTYLHPGLPPGPIASPGRASLRAALNPSTEAYLYFVAKPDGSHAFSRTYREHLNNQQRYQK